MRLRAIQTAILMLLAFACAEIRGQSSKPVVTVSTIAEMMARRAIPGESIDCQNGSTLNKWASGRLYDEFSRTVITNAHDGVHFITNARPNSVYVSRDRLAPEQDVRWFGAVMTNTVDSSEAIQAAIDYGANDDFYPATGRRGITVRIPAGELLVTNSVQLKPGTRLVGAGHENTVIFTSITNADTIYYVDRVAGISVVPEVIGLAINQTTNAVPTSGAGIHFYAELPGTSVSPVVRDVLVRKTYRGVVIDTAFQALLDHVRTFSCVEDGFRIEESADGVDSTSTSFLSCYAAANGGDGYDIIGSYHTLLGCASDSNGGYGYRGNRSASGYTLSNVSFNSCGAEANTLGGYYLLGAFATRIEGTVYGVAGNGHGITLDSGSGITISGRISSISATNVWAVYLNNSLGYYPQKVSILTDEIGDWGLGRVSDPSLVAHLSDSWKGAYPSVVYGIKPTSLPAGLTLAPTLAGTNGYNIGTYNTPNFSASASGFTAAEYVAMRYGFSGSQTLGAARIVAPPVISSGSVSYQVADWIQETTNGSSSDIAIWIGNSYPASGDYSIAVTTTNEARFAGLLSATTVRSTDASAVTKAELTTGGVVRGPFLHTTATNLTTAQPILKVGENTRYRQEGVVQTPVLMDLWFDPTNTTATQYGLDISYRANPVTQIGSTYGINLTGYSQTTGYVASLYGIGLNSTISGGGTVGNLAGAVIFPPTKSSGTVTNAYGLLISDQSAGINNYSLYTSAGQVRFGDDVTVATSKGITLGGVKRTTWPSAISDITGLQTALDAKQNTDPVLTQLAALTGGGAGQIITATGPGTFAMSNAPSVGTTYTNFWSDLTNALQALSNISFSYNTTNRTLGIAATAGGGSTNGTPTSVNAGGTLSAANHQSSARISQTVSGGTNIIPDIVADSVRTNELAEAAESYLLDLAYHTGILTTNKGGTGITNTTAAGQALLAAFDAAAQRAFLGLGALAILNDAPTNGQPHGRQDGAWVVVTNSGGGGGSTTISNVMQRVGWAEFETVMDWRSSPATGIVQNASQGGTLTATYTPSTTTNGVAGMPPFPDNPFGARAMRVNIAGSGITSNTVFVLKKLSLQTTNVASSSYTNTGWSSADYLILHGGLVSTNIPLLLDVDPGFSTIALGTGVDLHTWTNRFRLDIFDVSNVSVSGGSGSSGGTASLARFRAIQGEPPTNNYGVFSTRNSLGVMTFHESVNEALRFRWIVPEGTTATNVTVRLTWTTSATSGDGRWGARNWRLTGDIDTDDFATAVEGTTTTSGTAGTKMVTTLYAVGLDGAVAGDEVATEVYRDSSDGADTINSNRLELHSVEVLAE